MAIGKDVVLLMNKLNYSFSDLTYLESALTHSSYTNEMRSRGIRVNSNEALEFLGDAVLQIIISEALYDRYRHQGEGALTKMRQAIVCEGSLAEIARSINLGDFLNVGKGEESSDIRNRTKVLADALEALIAAIYLDSKNFDIKAVSEVVLSLFSEHLKGAHKRSMCDYKTLLQQFAEQNEQAQLFYELVSVEGPEHNKQFKVAAVINNNIVGKGEGSTKKAAEMQAAQAALKLFGVI